MSIHICHVAWLEDIIAKAAGELSPAQNELLERHLQTCPACLQQVNDFIFISNFLRPLHDDHLERPLPPEMEALKREIAKENLATSLENGIQSDE